MLGLALLAAPTFSNACDMARMTPAESADIEDRQLLASTVLYRGVIEDLRADDFGNATFTIRTVQTFWGSGAPERLTIPRAYFSDCTLGNLDGVYFGGEFGGSPVGRNGLGVTVLGRNADLSRPSRLFILVDGTDETRRVLGRFRELKRNQ